MKADFSGTDAGLAAAVSYVGALDADADFWRQVREKRRYTFATIAPAEVERRLRASPSTIKILLWTPKPADADRYKKTVAVTDSKFPRTLFYHTKFLGNDVGDKVNTIVHEFVHNVDAFDDGNAGRQMGHGGNSSRGKKDSAPYWIGGLAERIYRAAHPLALEKADIPHATYEHLEIEVDPADIVSG
jgi:hypothetical protein